MSGGIINPKFLKGLAALVLIIIQNIISTNEFLFTTYLFTFFNPLQGLGANSPFRGLGGMNVLTLFKPIKAFAFDVDGVLTDGSLFIMPDGEWVRKMNIKDGYALQLAIKKGYQVFVISGATSKPVAERLQKLGVKEVHNGVSDKKELLLKLINKYSISKEQLLYMGDDIPDYKAMQEAGLLTCPVDAAAEIKQICQYISPFKGGEGCVRDVLEKVMKLNKHWETDTTVASQ